MPDSRDPDTPLPPAPTAVGSPFGSSDSPTRFHEDPLLLGTRLAAHRVHWLRRLRLRYSRYLVSASKLPPNAFRPIAHVRLFPVRPPMGSAHSRVCASMGLQMSERSCWGDSCLNRADSAGFGSSPDRIGGRWRGGSSRRTPPRTRDTSRVRLREAFVRLLKRSRSRGRGARRKLETHLAHVTEPRETEGPLGDEDVATRAGRFDGGLNFSAWVRRRSVSFFHASRLRCI